MVNKKIKNATANMSSGILFKSKLESTIYNTLIDEGIFPQYEPITFTLWEGFTPVTPYYDIETKNQKKKRIEKGEDTTPTTRLRKKGNKFVSIKYTPDFYFKYKDINVYVEVKSIENDVFYIKKKLFIKLLDTLYNEKGEKSIYFEVHSKNQLYQALEILEEYALDIIKQNNIHLNNINNEKSL